MRVLVGIVLMLAATPAAACMRTSYAISFEDQINAEFKYLVCLHNEQNDALNRQAGVIKDLAQELDRKETQMQLLEQELDRVRRKVDELQP